MTDLNEEEERKIDEIVDEVVHRLMVKPELSPLITTETECRYHKMFREELIKSFHHSKAHLPGVRDVSKTGVIYVTARAQEQGFTYTSPDWANLGQGAPETGDIEGAPKRRLQVEFTEENNEYAPVAGIKELRQRIADLYNIKYRQGKPSQYTWENVCVCPGGRAALTRIAACLGDVNVGFFLPDYTAYEQMLSIFKAFLPIPHTLDASHHYQLSYDEMKQEIKSRGLSVVLLSNPNNPTGTLVEGPELQKLVSLGRKYHTTFIFDEFYSHYLYTHPPEQNGRTISVAEYVEDVDTDPILIVDGLTKNWRLPGWRICWTIGPKQIIDSMQSSSSFLDGGASHPMQDCVLRSNLLDIDFVHEDAKVLQTHFRKKRDYVLKRLTEMGFVISHQPLSTFYIWADVSHLPPPLNNGLSFFEEALHEKVICVPGIFFDVNPGKRRELFFSPYHHFIRLSFGPTLPILERGMDSFEKLIKKYTVMPVPDKK